MSESVIEIRNLKKEYLLGTIGGGSLRDNFAEMIRRRKGLDSDKFLALDGVNLTVFRGDTLGIVGANGAGKSTLLKLISRITAPTEGEIRIHGRIASMLEVGTGFHGELTGRENIYMNGAILGMKKAEIDRKLDDIIEFSECSQFIDTPVKRYSSGMYVKLAFSVAAHLDSEILIMDEVLAVGDMKFQKKCLEKMHGIAKEEGRTILYVSHNMNTISELCNRCIVLDHGKIILDGDTGDAVALYLDAIPEGLTSISYDGVVRYSWLSRDDVRLLYAELYGKTCNKYKKGELLHLKIRWKCKKDVEKLSFRMEIHNDSDHAVATSWILEFYTGKEGEISEAVFELDISSLTPGQYKTDYCFFNLGYFGDSIDFDCIHGLGFEIERDSEIDPVWKNEIWGNVKLPDMIPFIE